MDHFGIGSAVKSVAEVYFRSARRTGRTSSLVASVKNGDCIIFIDSREADRVKRLCRERGVEVECIVIDPKQAEQVYERKPLPGRTIFDHSWVEQYYRIAIDRAQQSIDCLERETSKHDETYWETRLQMEEMIRWKN